MGTFILFILVLVLFSRVSNLNARVNALEGNEPVEYSGVAKAAIGILFALVALFLLTVFSAPSEAGDWDYYYDDEPVEIYEVYPTRPGTGIRDYNQPGYRIEIDRFGNEWGYPLRPGTSIRDYNQPGYRLERR